MFSIISSAATTRNFLSLFFVHPCGNPSAKRSNVQPAQHRSEETWWMRKGQPKPPESSPDRRSQMDGLRGKKKQRDSSLTRDVGPSRFRSRAFWWVHSKKIQPITLEGIKYIYIYHMYNYKKSLYWNRYRSLEGIKHFSYLYLDLSIKNPAPHPLDVPRQWPWKKIPWRIHGMIVGFCLLLVY